MQFGERPTVESPFRNEKITLERGLNSRARADAGPGEGGIQDVALALLSGGHRKALISNTNRTIYKI
jgi:hypothetical protein